MYSTTFSVSDEFYLPVVSLVAILLREDSNVFFRISGGTLDALLVKIRNTELLQRGNIVKEPQEYRDTRRTPKPPTRDRCLRQGCANGFGETGYGEFPLLSPVLRVTFQCK